MRLADFDYALPVELIAQRPVSPRDASRLLVVDRGSGRLSHRTFREIGDYLRPGDALVVNDTRVLPARLRGRRAGTGGAVEVLVLRAAADGAWEALVQPGQRLREGMIVEIQADQTGGPPIALRIGARLPDGRRLVSLPAGQDMVAVLHTAGEVPVPPYIKRVPDDPEDYQTVYARVEGAVAAPTAGLHFTPGLLDALRGRGVRVIALTLHVGLGTFQAVTADDITQHRMDREHYTISPEAAAAINGRRGRLVAVGTTVVRALEGAAGPDGRVAAGSRWTDLFICPGVAFRAIEALVTNFHLPRTTLLMLVCAFAGRELILRAYDEAIRARYRFYSFGDAMLIL
jgi:S-adenosylmethionine:tRNA ribosyltransferase-isomerase